MAPSTIEIRPGFKFGMLTVIEREGSSADHHVEWLCRCDCGVEGVVLSQYLRRSKLPNCGCVYKKAQKTAAIIDLVGQTFGLLHVASRAGTDKFKRATWNCECTCGNNVILSGSQLRNTNRQDCGCVAVNSLVGQQFGQLTVTELVGVKSKGAGSREKAWRCLCTCGNYITIGQGNLKSGNTRSCGCAKLASAKHKERLRAYAENRVTDSTAIKDLSYYFRRNARVRNLPFELTLDDITSLTQQNCAYCGISPANLFRGAYWYNGIDRIDSNIGYTVTNCVPCCGECNRAKGPRSLEDFLLWVEKVYRYRHRNTV